MANSIKIRPKVKKKLPMVKIIIGLNGRWTIRMALMLGCQKAMGKKN
jgi:hypothetical protein